MELKKEAFRIQQELWNFTKKYLERTDNQSEEYWDGVRDDSNAIYSSTDGQPEYFRKMTSKMILGAIDLLEGIYREEKRT